MNWKQSVELYLKVGHCFPPAIPEEDISKYVRGIIGSMGLSEKSDLLEGLFTRAEMDKIKSAGSEGIITAITEAILRHHIIETFEFIRGQVHHG
jgi:hypothetical protein